MKQVSMVGILLMTVMLGITNTSQAGIAHGIVVGAVTGSILNGGTAVAFLAGGIAA